MNKLALDSSAIVAIINDEPEAWALSERIAVADSRYISTATLHEVYTVLVRSRQDDGDELLRRVLGLIEPVAVPFDIAQLEVSQMAAKRFGRGSGHPARLNMGDCFAYALAKTRDLPLLFKGDDFIHTDIRSALVA